MKNLQRHNSLEAIKELVNLVSKLRSPIGGCPWDLKQTHLSLIPYLLEEAHEVADAIRNKNDKDIKEELGDLLLQVALHAQIAKEEDRFCLEDIAKSINQKLIRRHPHVFDNAQVKSIEDVRDNWESIKMSEKQLQKSQSPITDSLKEKVRSQPAIAGAMEISKKLAAKGFGLVNSQDVWDKVNEEIEELNQALIKKDLANAQEEIGNIIFTLINVTRCYGVSAEEGLAARNKRFLERFSNIEKNFGSDFSSYSKNEFNQLWKSAKENIPPHKE